VHANLPRYRVLGEAERSVLKTMIQVFLEEKQWEGVGESLSLTKSPTGISGRA
jgi:Mlc titration factor MtfA (ptsG expression regulator)